MPHSARSREHDGVKPGKGTERELRTEIGTAAMIGRLIGILAKGIVGIAIFVVQLVSFWL